MRRLLICRWMLLIGGPGVEEPGLAEAIDGFRVKRQELFEFTGKPAVKREGKP